MIPSVIAREARVGRNRMANFGTAPIVQCWTDHDQQGAALTRGPPSSLALLPPQQPRCFSSPTYERLIYVNAAGLTGWEQSVVGATVRRSRLFGVASRRVDSSPNFCSDLRQAHVTPQMSNETAPVPIAPVAAPEIRIGSNGFLNGESIWNSALALIIFQILLILCVSRGIGKAFSYIREPMVVAEMVAGIILGPSVLGRIPGWKANLFPTSSISNLAIVSNIGLVLFMFVVGMEVDVVLLRKTSKSAALSSLIGVLVPFAFSIPVAFALNTAEFHTTQFYVFYLFLSIVMGISALPVLARIISEYNFLASPLGVFTMSATTFDDLLAWPILALIVALAGIANYLSLLWIVLCAAGITLLVFFPIRLLINFVNRRTIRQKSHSEVVIFLVLAMALFVAWLCEIVGITALIGAFGVGCIIPRSGNLVPELTTKVEDLVVIIFMPIFFTVSGLKTEFSLVDSGNLWGLTLLIIALSCLGKVTGCAAPARWIGKLSWLDSIIFGVLMNTKGLVALISLNLGLSANIITPKLFTMCVIMVLVNTVITGPLVALLYRIFKRPDLMPGTNLEGGNVPRVVVHVAHEKTAPLVVSVGSLLYQTEEQIKLILIRITNKSDRPSDYMSKFSLVAMRRDPVLRLSLKAGKAFNTSFKVKFQSLEKSIPSDLETEVLRENANLLITGSRKPRSSGLIDILKTTTCDVICVIGKVKQFQTLTNATATRKVLLVLPPPDQQTEHDKFALANSSRLARATGVTVIVLTLGNEEFRDANKVWQHFVDSSDVQTIFEPTLDLLNARIEEETQTEDYAMSMCAWNSPYIDAIRAASKQPLVLAFSAKMRSEFLSQLEKEKPADSDPDEDGAPVDEEELAEDTELFMAPIDNQDTEKLTKPSSPSSRRRKGPTPAEDIGGDDVSRSNSKVRRIISTPSISVPALGIVDSPAKARRHDSRSSEDAQAAAEKQKESSIVPDND